MRGELAEDLLNAEELVDLGLSGEESVTVRDFAHDTANRPNVDLLSILVTQEELGCPVPSRRDVVREVRAGLLELPCEAEIADFQLVASNRV